MHVDMVERVARAIFNTDNPTFDFEKDLSDSEKNEYRNKARAAIEAMREPTGAMLDAARDWSLETYGKPIGIDAAIGCWKTMIDAR